MKADLFFFKNEDTRNEANVSQRFLVFTYFILFLINKLFNFTYPANIYLLKVNYRKQ